MERINIAIDEKNYSWREQIKTLRTNLQFCGDEKRVIMVTSCLPGEGKTEVSIELAKTFTDMGKSVLLLDLDLRKSVLASRLKVGAKIKGASHFLSGQAQLSDVVYATNLKGLYIMDAGPAVPNPTELLESNRFTAMMDYIKNYYDYIIIDCPPLGLVIDAAIIAKQCDGSILVVESGETKYRLAQDVKGKLDRTGTPILGVVLNKVELKKQKAYYNKYYGKKYGKSGYGYAPYYMEESSIKKK